MMSLTRIGALASIALLASACMPKTSMRVLQPASVDVPADIQVIGIVDRSGPANAGEHVLGTIEGLLTGESIGGDRNARAAAIEAAVRVLEESPRFEVVRPTLPDAAGGSLWDQELEQRLVERICRQAGCDALLVLEAFDSDSALRVNGVNVTSLSNPQQLARQVQNLDVNDVSASSDATVMASWRMYDADQDRVVDELRDRSRTWSWQNSGTLADVQRAMPAPGFGIERAGAEAGAAYAARIAPSWQWVERRYYGSGDPRLRDAKRYVKAGDWDGAMRLWSTLLDDPRPNVRGKAAFNLALAHEVQGDFGKALDLARDAAVALSNGKSRDYVFELEQRVRDEERLARQMTPAPEETPARERTPSRDGKVRPERPTRPTSSTSSSSRTTAASGMSRPR